jgi:hypothetical protein
MKVVINKCYGGFDISHAGMMDYARRKGLTLYAWVNPKHDFSSYVPYDGQGRYLVIHYTTAPLVNGGIPNEIYFSNHDIARDDPDLVAMVDELGERASGQFGELKVVEIPDGTEYEIEEYDGLEHIAEKHQVWY